MTDAVTVNATKCSCSRDISLADVFWSWWRSTHADARRMFEDILRRESDARAINHYIPGVFL